MRQVDQLFVFGLDGNRYALHLEAVDRVVAVVHVTPLPKAPEIVTGIVNVRGTIVPVVDIRRRFMLSPRTQPALSDIFIIAHTSRRPVALAADNVSGVLHSADAKIIAAADLVPESDYIEGIVRLADGMILIHDLNSFLSIDEEETLDRAIADG